MGIYPEVRIEIDNHRQTLTRTVHTPGLDQVFVYQLVARLEDRTDCYCCSCGEYVGTDSACRNHGWYARRPCDIHDMPGEAWEDSDTMPASVSQSRADNQ